MHASYCVVSESCLCLLSWRVTHPPYPLLQDTFIGFGGNVVREKVKLGAPWYVYDFQELIDELVLPTVAGMTRAKRLALQYVNGVGDREQNDQKLQEE